VTDDRETIDAKAVHEIKSVLCKGRGNANTGCFRRQKSRFAEAAQEGRNRPKPASFRRPDIRSNPTGDSGHPCKSSRGFPSAGPLSMYAISNTSQWIVFISTD
jgi:hypothetical protein